MIKNSKLVRYIRKIVGHPLFTGSMVMIIGSNLYNAGQFAYHIVAARILGKAFYGDLAALVNVLGIFALIQISVGLTIVKFVASEKDENQLQSLIRWAVKWSFLIGLFVAIGLVATGGYIGSFLNLIQPLSLYLLALVILVFAVTNIARSVLQGLLKFNWYVGSLFTEVGIKLILMIPLVLLGYAVMGAMVALLVGVLCSLFIGIYSLRKHVFGKAPAKTDVKPLIRYSLPAFLQGLALTSMYSTDLFLVKHFFSPESAGLYAGMAKLGTIVFFGSTPVVHVMFPLVARKHAHGDAYHKIFYLSLLLMLGIISLVVLAYIFFPQVFLGVLGSNFLEGSKMLWWFGVFMGLLAIAMLFVQFYLSVGKTFMVALFLLGALLQVTLIWFFHATLVMVVQMSIISASLLVISLLVYFPYHHPSSPKGFGGTSRK